MISHEQIEPTRVSLTDFRSILASTPIRESRIKLTIHFSPSSFDRLSVFDRSLITGQQA